MGRDSTFYCQTCKVSIALGYGSYRTWLDDKLTLDDYDRAVAAAPSLGELRKNKNHRAALAAHEGHEIFTGSRDWYYQRSGALCYDDGRDGTVVIPDYATWTHVRAALAEAPAREEGQ